MRVFGRAFEEVFEQYGLPKVIRSDNGGPFACTRALAGLTRLSAWWKAQGIGLDPDARSGATRNRMEATSVCTGTSARSCNRWAAGTWKINRSDSICGG